MDGRAIAFGPYRLLAAQRLLLEGGRPVRLGGRAFDILTALIERAGEVVGKEELIARAWPATFVEEANLKIQVSALRRALGDGQDGNRYVATVVGRGYNFVAPIRKDELGPTSSPAIVAWAAAHNLPFATTRMIGRGETATALVTQLSRERLVTVVGPGGIGKTTVALAVAERVIDAYEQGVWLVELSPIRDPRLVPSAVATVLGLEIPAEDPLPSLVAALRDSRVLLLLDNCEHVIESAACLAAAILGKAPGVKILATSREALAVSGEHEHHLGPLSSPEPSSALSAAEVGAFSAIQLFVERATASVEDFRLTDSNARLVVEICRQLDGLPMAIEFAAPSIEVLGLDGLATRLRGNLPLLGAPRRAATPRHRTMRDVVDWSYGLLSKDEQSFFRALGIFTGGISVEAAAAVAMGAATSGVDAINHLADLVAKSLLVADVSGARPRFRLLGTTRAFAVEKLGEVAELEQRARRHAEYYRDLFARAEGEAPTRPATEWLLNYAPEIDNLRSALDWAFSPGGDGSIGVALTASAVPLWMRLSLLDECRGRAKQALGALSAGVTPATREAMQLHAALGASTSEASELGAAFTQALDFAETLGDIEYQLRALRGLFSYYNATGRYRAAMPFAQKFHDLTKTSSDPNDRLFGERMLGVAKHFLGDQIGARRHLEQVLARYTAVDLALDASQSETDLHVVRFHTDLRISARVYHARVLWLQGFSDRAVHAAETSIKEAQAIGHALSLCTALALAACPIALWTGDLAAAARYTGMLLDHSRKHGLRLWSTFGLWLQRAVAIRRGDPDAGFEPAESRFDGISPSSFSFRFLTGLIELADALSRAGRIAEGLAIVEAAIAQSEEGWLTPELQRLKGELLLFQGVAAIAEQAANLFQNALDSARRQEILSWELRAATSLAGLLSHQGRPVEAIAALQPVYGRFAEGFGSADLIAAKRLLAEFGYVRT